MMSVCRVCGCTDLLPCILDAGGQLVDVDDGTLSANLAALDGCHPCSWVEPDLCSGCVQPPAPPPLLYDAYGKPLRGAP